MPLIKVDVIKGRSAEQLRLLLDVVHAAMVSAFSVPARDRYQIVTEHEPGHMIAEDTGLGFKRTSSVVMVQVTTRPRSQAEKLDFYKRLATDLHVRCGIDGKDLMVAIVENTDADWSFGFGSAQFITRELPKPGH